MDGSESDGRCRAVTPGLSDNESLADGSQLNRQRQQWLNCCQQRNVLPDRNVRLLPAARRRADPHPHRNRRRSLAMSADQLGAANVGDCSDARFHGVLRKGPPRRFAIPQPAGDQWPMRRPASSSQSLENWFSLAGSPAVSLAYFSTKARSMT